MRIRLNGDGSDTSEDPEDIAEEPASGEVRWRRRFLRRVADLASADAGDNSLDEQAYN